MIWIGWMRRRVWMMGMHKETKTSTTETILEIERKKRKEQSRWLKEEEKKKKKKREEKKGV